MSEKIHESAAREAREGPTARSGWTVRVAVVRPSKRRRDGFPLTALVAAGAVAAGALAWFVRWRIADEEERRRDRVGQVTPFTANAHKALAMKRAHEADAPEPPSDPTPHAGMRSIPNTGIAPSGALQQEGHRPVLERSRKVR